MTQQTAFFPLEGGLDLTTPAIAARPGAAAAALNYEPAATGYRRFPGFERHDGRTSPTDAFNAESDPVAAEAAKVAARAAITAVPGSGPVRGVWSYNGEEYAFRDDAGATACVMHKATAAGWVAVTMSKQLNFTSGGTTEIAEGNTITGATSGATALVKRVVTTSGDWAAGTAAGYFVFDSQTGTFVAEDLNVGASLNLATIAGNSSTITLPAGGRYEFVTHNFYGASNLLRMYGCNGVGKAFEFDGTTFCPITTGAPTDTPHRIGVHKKALLLGFPGGSSQLSQVGEPLSWSAILGAAEIAIGDEITDYLALPGGATAILGRQTISVLYGSDSADYTLETLSDEAGALPWTAERMDRPLYMDSVGVRSLAASQAYGNFSIGTMTQAIEALLQQKRAGDIQPVASCRVRNKSLYRLFFDDHSGISIYTGKKRPEILPFDLGLEVTCICSVEDTDRRERIFFGSDNGFVYEMEKGTSFDGEEIASYLRLPFWHGGAPQLNKRFHKAVLECEAQPGTELSVSADFDYGSPYSLGAPVVSATPEIFNVEGGGGSWDISNWDAFYWSSQMEGLAEAYLDGVGKNMSLLIASSSALQASHLLQGMTYFFTPRGLQR